MGGRKSDDVLAAIVSEPGERSPCVLAEEMGLPLKQVQREVRRLRRAELAAPALCRIVPHHSGTGLAQLGLAECSMARRIWQALVEGDGSDAAQSRPKSRRALAAALEVAEDAGQFRRAIVQLHSFGSLSLPKEVWPTQAGTDSVRASEVGPLSRPEAA